MMLLYDMLTVGCEVCHQVTVLSIVWLREEPAHVELWRLFAHVKC